MYCYMAKMIILLNHELSDSQRQEIAAELSPDSLLLPPLELAELWQNITPQADSLTDLLEPICLWLQEVARKDDFLLVQGEAGSTYYIVDHAFDLGLVPLHATTRRCISEQRLPDGSTETIRNFEHCLFRKYERNK